MKKIVIAIDGFSSCGKSTLAKQLAQKLDYLYIDSGAMYRAITLYFLRSHVDWSDAQSVIHGLAQIVLSFNRDPETWLNEV
jgi:cytidylate kinase